MKNPLILIALVVLCCSFVNGQDAVKHKLPLAVSHLSTEHREMLRRPAAPKHNFLTKILCFKKPCRGYIGWQNRQRRQRFKGYKDGGKVPIPVQPKKMITPDTVIARQGPPLTTEKTDNIRVSADQLFILDEVLFELNSATLNKNFTFKLDSLIKLLEAHPELKAHISGHTDNSGSEVYNLKLSKARAQSVANHLKKKSISADRISAEGFGNLKPIASNQSKEGKRKNRRVEILLSRD
jgi:outer membrane protein OmpA-like peptidoglycan-associated protein